MFHVTGHDLDHVWELRHWQIAAKSLAELQLASTSHSDALIAAGCEDLRIPRLRSLVAPFLSIVGRLMAVQPARPPHVLEATELQFIERELIFACDRIEELGLPVCIGNTDLNPGNVLVGEERAVFIDWMQGNVSHPFLTFEYLISLCRRLRPDFESWLNPIRESYCSAWREASSELRVNKVLNLVPLVAMLAFGVSYPGWDCEIWSIHPDFAKLIRSLGRKMFVEAQRLQSLDPH